MATFSPMNFPKDVGNNKDFKRIGERTIYVPESATQFKHTDGFFTDRATNLYSTSGKNIKQVSKGKTVHFTYPAKLLKGSQLNITGASAKSIFTGNSHVG